MTTKLPSIPAFTGDNTAAVLSAISEALQVRTGQRGDTLDAGVTFRDLADLSLVQNTETTGNTTGGGTTSTSAGRVTVIPNTNPITLYDGTKDLKTPPSPTGLKATAVFGTVMLSWDQSAVLNLSFTEVYKSFTNDVTTATLAGTSSSQFFNDNAGSNRTIFYWVRSVSQAAVKSAWNSTAGTAVTTTLDPAVIIKSLEGQILESSLSQALASKISDAYDGSAGIGGKIIAERNARVAGILAEAQARATAILAEATARGAAITNEATTRQTADSSLATQISTVTASVGTNAAAIQTETTARVSADSALSQQITTLASTVSGAGYATTAYLQQNYYTKTGTDGAISSATTALGSTFNNTLTGYVTGATLTSDYYTKSGTTDAIAAYNLNLNSSFTNKFTGYTSTADLQLNYYTKTDANSAIATATTAVSARLNNIGGVTLEQNLSATATTTGGLSGQYTVKIDNNGHMAGFGLASTVVNGTPSSAFIIRADKFAIVDPASSSNSLTNTPSADTVPFFVESGQVYIKSAVIKNAAITSAQIGSLDAKKITSGYTAATIGMSAAKLHGAELYAGGTTYLTYDGEGYPNGMTTSWPTFKVANGDVEIVASNFKIKQNTYSGSTTPFEVVGGEVRITSAAIGTGTITTANIAETLQSTNYSSTAGWQINKSGTAIFNQATIRATLASSDNLFVIDMANKFISISV
jgi:hypothetical protein